MRPNLVNRRRLLRSLGASALGLAVAGCAIAPTPTPPPSPTTATAKPPATQPTAVASPAAATAPPKPAATTAPAAPKPLIKVVAGHPTRAIELSLWYLGKEKGYFRDEGLDLEMQQVGSASAIKAMVAGEMPFILVVGTTVSSIIDGAPLKVIVVTSRGPLSWIYARPPYKTLADLRGRNIAVGAVGDLSHNLVRALFRQAGMNPDADANYVAIPGASQDRLKAMLSGAIDATVLFSPDNLVADQQGLNRVLFFPDYKVAIGANGASTTDQMIRDRPDVVQAFVRGSLKGLMFLKSNKAEAVRLLTPFMNVEPEQVSAIYDLIVPSMNADGNEDDAYLQAMLDEQKWVSQVEKPVAMSQVFDMRFVRRAGQEIKASGWKP